jgi:hypothetical protein
MPQFPDVSPEAFESEIAARLGLVPNFFCSAGADREQIAGRCWTAFATMHRSDIAA